MIIRISHILLNPFLLWQPSFDQHCQVVKHSTTGLTDAAETLLPDASGPLHNAVCAWASLNFCSAAGVGCWTGDRRKKIWPERIIAIPQDSAVPKTPIFGHLAQPRVGPHTSVMGTP